MTNPRRLNIKEGVLLFLILAAFVFHSISLDFTQDDAYISYRYVENFVDGHGLVFNIGERVEGYTNFLWIMLLSLATLVGLPIIAVSKVLGVVFGAGVVVLAYLMGREFSDRKRWLVSMIAPLFLAANGALCYWVIGGLETGMFVFLVSLTLYTELRKPALTPFVLIVTTLTRPEGGLLFGIIFIYRLLITRPGMKSLAVYAASYVGLLLPYLAFKLVYFGDLLPNPFYAKTGMSVEYIGSGIEYFGKFAYHYGLFGLFFLMPILHIRRLPHSVKLFWLTSIIFTLYIILVGGDVLKVHRFFLPVLTTMFLIAAFMISQLLRDYGKRRVVPAALMLVCLVYVAWSLKIPYSYIDQTRYLERNFSIKMTTVAENLKKIDKSDFSVATTTIGKVSHVLKDHKVIDMLGLTDREIAKHPEHIEGMQTTWKERNFNTAYLLELKPDYVLFSTGHKPSAPAERALVLNSQFRRNYSTIGFISGNKLKVVWKKYGDFSEPNIKLPTTELADEWYDGLNMLSSGKLELALEHFARASELCDGDLALIEHFRGVCYNKLGDQNKALEFYEHARSMSPNHLEARLALMRYYIQTENTTGQRAMTFEIRRIAPWLLQ